MKINHIYQGDCLKIMATFPENSIDSIVTDPPYGLEFMGKEWDAPWKGKASKDFNTSCEGKLGGFKRLPNNSRVNNLKCKKCNKWKFSSNPCKCENPEFPNARLMAMIELENWIKLWATECLRVLKPGGYLLSFGGTRTYHRMTCAIEDAGFEIRDCIMWVYGSGFPKSLDISKAIDMKFFIEKFVKEHGRKPTKEEKKKYREIIGKKQGTYADIRGEQHLHGDQIVKARKRLKIDITEPTTPEAKQWEGWGTALKPAVEPIVVARKPLSEKTVAQNVLKWGTGGINIDKCRIGTIDKYSYKKCGGSSFGIGKGKDGTREYPAETNPQGRFPANIILECICNEVKEGEEFVSGSFPEERGETAFFGLNKKHRHRVGKVIDKAIIHTNPECPCYMLDEQSGKTGAFAPVKSGQKGFGGIIYGKYKQAGDDGRTFYGDGLSGASRFFYVAKASREERNRGLEGFKKEEVIRQGLAGEHKNPLHQNNHPTVKPIKLMEYLVRLVTPPKGIVLDPFIGSGTTAIACKKLGFNWVGIEKEKEYCEIAEARIKATVHQTTLF